MDAHFDGGVGGQDTAQESFREGVLDMPFDGAPKRPGAVGAILEGFAIWRALLANNGGEILVDLDKQQIFYLGAP